MTKYQELTGWIEANAAHLKGYSTDEVANLAIAVGMDRSAVAQWTTNKIFNKVA